MNGIASQQLMLSEFIWSILSECIWAGLAAIQMTDDHDEVMMPLLVLFAQLPASC